MRDIETLAGLARQVRCDRCGARPGWACENRRDGSGQWQAGYHGLRFINAEHAGLMTLEEASSVQVTVTPRIGPAGMTWVSAPGSRVIRVPFDAEGTTADVARWLLDVEGIAPENSAIVAGEIVSRIEEDELAKIVTQVQSICREMLRSRPEPGESLAVALAVNAGWFRVTIEYTQDGA